MLMIVLGAIVIIGLFVFYCDVMDAWSDVADTWNSVFRRKSGHS